MSYPTQLDCQLLQTWEEQLPHLTLLSWYRYYQLLMHDLLGLQAWSEYFPCLTLLTVLSWDYQLLLQFLIGMRLKLLAWSE
jgi:hypothetical protein